MNQPLLLESNAQDVQSFSRAQQFSRWVLSVLCVVFSLASLEIYQKKGNITSTQVKTFNAITTTLGLIMGLCFFDAFKDLAKVSRWRILASQGWSDLEKDLIRDAVKLTAVIELGWKSHAKPVLLLVCVLWIALNVSAQIAVALINQIYSVQDGTNWHGTYVRAGQVDASDLTCYYHHYYDAQTYTCDWAPETLHGIVHAYGEYAFGSISNGNDCVNYTTIEDILRSRSKPKYYCRRAHGQQEFAYRFLEYNPQDQQRTYPFLTDRVITASAGQCYNYSVSKFQLGVLGGKWSNYTYNNKTFSDSMLLPAQIDTFDGTVYSYRGSNIPQNATTWSCGPRCIWMWAHKTANDKNPSTFYQCPVTVYPVTMNSVQFALEDAHQVPDDIARLAASSIGLQGGKSDHDNGWSQFQFYPIASAWDIHGKSSDEVGANMAEFALGSIATIDSNNPSIQIHGHLPVLGSHLDVTWPFAIALLVSIAGVHSAVFAWTMYADWWNRAHLTVYE